MACGHIRYLFIGIGLATDNILPGLDTTDFSLPGIAVTHSKQSDIHKAKRLVRRKIALTLASAGGCTPHKFFSEMAAEPMGGSR